MEQLTCGGLSHQITQQTFFEVWLPELTIKDDFFFFKQEKNKSFHFFINKKDEMEFSSEVMLKHSLVCFQFNSATLNSCYIFFRNHNNSCIYLKYI